MLVSPGDEPEQLVDDRLQVELLGGDQGKAGREVEAQLGAEEAQRAVPVRSVFATPIRGSTAEAPDSSAWLTAFERPERLSIRQRSARFASDPPAKSRPLATDRPWALDRRSKVGLWPPFALHPPRVPPTCAATEDLSSRRGGEASVYHSLSPLPGSS